MTLIKKLIPIISILALISITILGLFNLNNLLVKTETIEGMKIYTFDLYTYITNINRGFSTEAIQFETIIPSRTWDKAMNNGIDIPKWIATFINNFALMIDWLYFPINFILYTIRWTIYIIEGLLTLIGWPIKAYTTDLSGHIKNTPVYSSILVTILEWAKVNLIIPYL